MGGYLYLRGTGVKDNSKVRRELTDEQKKKIRALRNGPLFWQWDGRSYIKADGIFSEIVSHKGNLYRIRQIGKVGTAYLLTDGEGNWAHGDTLEEAKGDLLYKISARDKSEYRHLTPESALTFEEAVLCYRVITGACGAGTRDYIKNRLPKPRKEEYTIAEIIALTRGEYGGSRFEEFFSGKKDYEPKERAKKHSAPFMIYHTASGRAAATSPRASSTGG